MDAALTPTYRAPCDVLLGIMTTDDTKGRERRLAARTTWLPTLQNYCTARFLVRAGSLRAGKRRSLMKEPNSTAGDLLRLPVSAHAERDGRILTLLAWFRMAPAICPSARWVAKSDDDTYVHAPSWTAHLRAIDASRDVGSLTVFGAIFWHTWNTLHFMGHSFDWTYNPSEARRAIDYLEGGDTSRAPNSGYRDVLERCRREGAGGCGWCPVAANCSGPYPFASGWLISLSAELAWRLAASPSVHLEEHAARRAAQGPDWGKPMFEDMWLGSAIDRFVRDAPVTFVSSVHTTPSHAYFLNGEYERARGGRVGWVNTTFVFHNPHFRRIQKQLQRAHEATRPLVRCGGRADPKLRRMFEGYAADLASVSASDAGEVARGGAWRQRARKGVAQRRAVGDETPLRSCCSIDERVVDR